MVDLRIEFADSWKDYGIKHGIDLDSKSVEHAIRASVEIIDMNPPSIFDWERYIIDNPKLEQSLGKGSKVDVNSATCHYLNHGIREKRRAFKLGSNEPYEYDFDWKMYDKLNSDVYTQRERGDVIGRWHCFRHWCEFGHKEGRPTGNKCLVVKNNASISEDEDVNKQWRANLMERIQPEYKTVDDLINHINQIKDHATRAEINTTPLSNIVDHSKYFPLVVMPTYNRAKNIDDRIQMMLNQTARNWTFLIIDDGSTPENKTAFKSVQDKYKDNKKILFLENETNKHIAFTLNRGLQYFLDNKSFTHFTWVSDDNEYYPNFLEKLYIPNKDFTYGWYDILYTTEKNNGKMATIKRKLGNLEILLERFDGCAAFLWSRKVIEKIGIYSYLYPCCEDYEYILRTVAELSMDKIEQVPTSLMKYIRHPDCECEKTKDEMIKYTRAIRMDFKTELYSKKISIVMAYCNRKSQTLETLNCFEKMYSGEYNFEVIIVDDNSNDENRLEEVITQFTFPINLIVIGAEEKGNRLNPCIAYNKGLSEATGEIIIVQNSECVHIKDMLNHIIYNLKERDCFSYNPYIENDCDNSENNCCVIRKEHIDLIGGFDKRFEQHHGYHFNTLFLAVKYNLKLKITDHSNLKLINNKEIHHKPTQNKKIYNDIIKIHKRNDFIYPKLLFLYWDGSPLSYLNYLTVITFNKYNPEWKIIVFKPLIKTEGISWKGAENKILYNKTDHFDKLLNISNITISYVDLTKIGFDNNASEVIKSDYFRYYILEKYGGLWSDFDIIYTDSIEQKMNFKDDSVIFKCTGFHDLKRKLHPFHYFPIGLFLTKAKSSLFKFITQQCIKFYDSSQYQSIGATMWNYLFKINEDVFNIQNSVSILDNTYYLPFQCNEIDTFLDNLDLILPPTTVGIHWFNGGVRSKQYSIDLDSRLSDFKTMNFLDQTIYPYIKQSNLIKYNTNTILLISESSYPGGGGEEFMLDIANYFNNHNYTVYWITFHDWGKSKHSTYKEINKKIYIEIQIPTMVNSLDNFNILSREIKNLNVNFIVHQGLMHKLVCDIGNAFNIPTITFWCFWEEALDINWKYGLLEIKNNLDKHNKSTNFEYIIDNIDHYYFASKFVRDIINQKYKFNIDDTHVFPTLSCSNRFVKDYNIDSFNSKYITLLDAHTLKGGDLFAKLILMNPNLAFLAIKTEDEDAGPNAITKSIETVNNGKNIIHLNRINDVNTIYNQTKILLCPTQLDETFCRVVYEAFANKIPVIFSNSGNLDYITGENILKISEYKPELYNEQIHKLTNDKSYYQKVVNAQYDYYIHIKQKSDLSIIEDKLREIENEKNKNVGIFTPWCDQGLGIQSRIYKKLLENMGYNVFIFATKPYVATSKSNLISNKNEWETNNIYRSPNKRLDVSLLELDLFIANYKIKSIIIPEIQYQLMFDISDYLKTKQIKTFAIPNIECIQDRELEKFSTFEKVFVNNKMSYEILQSYNLTNVEYLGFHYDIPDCIKINEINYNKQVVDEIQIFHLSGLNGLFRKRTDIIVNIFEKLHNEGVKFKLNIVIQGNFDDNKKQIFNKPFINLIDNHLSYTEILNLYNENHISIQISKHEGLGLGFFESCFMNTPVITLNAPPHNEVIQHGKNGWLLTCTVAKDEKPENPFTIIEQTQIDEQIIIAEIRKILSNTTEINNVIKNTKSYTETRHSYEQFKTNFNSKF